jgi:GNAT superfamily N-acetyltransferase
MVIGDLEDHRAWIPTLARWHFDQWGPLTGASTFDAYIAFLTAAAQSRTVPSVLVALADGQLLGSASLVASDLPLRPHLTPWLAQVFVEPGHRRHGVGAALVDAVLERSRQCGYRRVYLYTSGTLPAYYARLGWREVEHVEYLGRGRTVMDFDLGTGEAPNHGMALLQRIKSVL